MVVVALEPFFLADGERVRSFGQRFYRPLGGRWRCGPAGPRRPADDDALTHNTGWSWFPLVGFVAREASFLSKCGDLVGLWVIVTANPAPMPVFATLCIAAKLVCANVLGIVEILLA